MCGSFPHCFNFLSIKMLILFLISSDVYPLWGGHWSWVEKENVVNVLLRALLPGGLGSTLNELCLSVLSVCIRQLGLLKQSTMGCVAYTIDIYFS